MLFPMTKASSPHTISELIDALGGNAAVAKIIGKQPSAVSEMRRSGNIRVRYWPPIIDAARRLGVPGVNSDALMRMCATIEAA
jgi:hypothetical protein